MNGPFDPSAAHRHNPVPGPPPPAYPAPGQRWPGTPPGYGPPPKKRRLGLWLGLGGVAVLLVVAVIAAVIVVVVRSGGLSSGDQLIPGDDTVYADEASDALLGEGPPQDVIAPLSGRPALMPLAGYARSATRVQDGNGARVILTADGGTTLIGVDATTAEPVFRTSAPPGATVNYCALTGNRIACTASLTESSGTEYGLAIRDAGTGRILRNGPDSGPARGIGDLRHRRPHHCQNRFRACRHDARLRSQR